MGKTRFKYVRRRTLERTRHSTYFLSWLDAQAARLEVTAEDVYQLLLDGMSALQIDGIPDPGPPESVTAPEIVGAATATTGVELTTVAGRWLGGPVPVVTQVWEKANAAEGPFTPIVGETATSYTPAPEDAGAFLRYTETATNTEGTETANSNVTIAVQSAPANTVAPVVSGTAEVAETLTTTEGTWTGEPEPTYVVEWQRSEDGVDSWETIEGEQETTYLLVEADEGKYIRSYVTATNAVTSSSVGSEETGPILPEEI